MDTSAELEAVLLQMGISTLKFTVRGFQLGNLEWAVRGLTIPIILHRSDSDPSFLADGIEILPNAVGLYHHPSKTYISVEQLHAGTFTDPNDIKDWDRSKAEEKRGEKIWDLVYHRPLAPVDSHTCTRENCEAEWEKAGLTRTRPTGFWREVRRCAGLLLPQSHLNVREKRPLIYVEDLEMGRYMPTWRSRAKGKLERKIAKWRVERSEGLGAAKA
ncbi:hypothetical protein ABW19_dt0207173 [Dactylella cylindrospora]|nr:hypothetical protein ABW19_dt0207173 [Dactylella cylindrospora]